MEKHEVINTVIVSARVARDLEKIPKYIVIKLKTWIALVELQGVEKTRFLTGYHDEPLRGMRTGQRSIRLNKAYRAIYIINVRHELEFVSIEEVHKHDY